ncbi:hypothetical protein GRF59_11960 [Paenibacillus sp. HJL G12]|uniref:GrpB family protein n=1 Tax=Paenibacillus dendrobii TaxID=2691084 RepID=A0A7X3LHL7_9BACL|nr:GrpB family protein [Paenibacillus dendrobii]MWV44345.1 hypothetical protein [Paenibacillus dendrobii]
MVIDESIHLSPFKERWKDIYLIEEQILRTIFDPSVEFEHIGSTAIEGMVAKPSASRPATSSP